MSELRLSPISAVERETGLSKDVLRKWESRYGFPVPARGNKGERLYPEEQLSRLRLIKRLMDGGLRPADIVALERSALEQLVANRLPAPVAAGGTGIGETIVQGLRRHDVEMLRRTLRGHLLRYGIESFVLDTMPTLNEVVGDAWASGDIQVFEEHLYSELIQGLLREAVATIAPDAGHPRVLLTTPPGELHTLGILMVEAALSLHGAQCICLGAQTPLADIVQAAAAFEIDIVALSFSIAYPARRIEPALAELRAQLQENVALWAGGAGAARQGKAPAGVRLLPSLEAAVAELARVEKPVIAATDGIGGKP